MRFNANINKAKTLLKEVLSAREADSPITTRVLTLIKKVLSVRELPDIKKAASTLQSGRFPDFPIAVRVLLLIAKNCLHFPNLN